METCISFNGQQRATHLVAKEARLYETMIIQSNTINLFLSCFGLNQYFQGYFNKRHHWYHEGQTG